MDTLTLIGTSIGAISLITSIAIGIHQIKIGKRQIEIADEQANTKKEIATLKIKITTIENNNVNVTGSGTRGIIGNVLGGSISNNEIK